MKEAIKDGILLVLVIVFAVIVVTTKGDDPLVWNVNLDLSGWPTTEEEFSYQIVSSDFNGQYRNNKGNSIYALMGENPDGTYRIYFIHQMAATKDIVLKLDSATLNGNKINFKNADGIPLYIALADNSFTVSADMSLGDAQLEGYYGKIKTINTFSMSEFDYYDQIK